VVGLTLKAAKKKLRIAHCGLGRVRSARSRRIGRVIKQSPKPGKNLRNRGRVNLVIGRR